MVRHVGSPICVVHVDVTLDRIKVTSTYLLRHFGVELKTDG